MDKTAIRDIRQRLQKLVPALSGSHLTEEPTITVGDLVKELGKTDIVVSSRFHGVLLAHLLTKPVIAVSYHEKINSLMRDMGQPEAVVQIDDFNVSDLAQIFAAVRADMPAIKSRLETRSMMHRQTLDRVYDELVGSAED